MKEMSKAYEPQQYEDSIYRQWEKSGFFNPDKLPGTRNQRFAVAMPPPNVTGVLHLGHALENALMDITIRYQRLLGKKVLLVPGTDHAAVATQAKVERDLIKNQGFKDPRAQLGREKLLELIRKYAANSQKIILGQIKKLGTSCDWSRLAYTFDEARNKAVNEAFVKMYNDGLIYRGYRAVNWSVKGQSTCSDDELVYETRQAILYTFKYSADFPIPISSTQPETKLGDTAVAINPADQRYQQYIGKTYTVDIGAAKPLTIKIIADQSIEMDFGTGAMGVTPAHSLADYDLSLKHKLDLVQVIGKDGKMTAAAGKNYAGLAVLEAREKFVAYLKSRQLIIKEEEIEQNVGASDRFGDVVEVLPMTQWFVAVAKTIPGRNKSLKQLMKTAMGSGSGKIKITPVRFVKTYWQWIDNLRDWCISRQIWWGHRLPVWYNGKKIFVGISAPKGEGWTQDEDTLDTWFSSSLWTFSILGWPAKTKDFRAFHPTSWMQMGYEILFFWMARMILMSSYLLKTAPFKEVYIHGILRNKEGQKFSKSLGTGIDPLEVIKTYGADALRLSLIMGVAPGNDARFYFEKVEGTRNFVNKLWNISRYILSTKPAKKAGKLTLADQWILSEFNILIKKITVALAGYNFSLAAELLYDFTWNKLADWYLEIAKIEQGKEKLLREILAKLLVLWHPFCPFVTEAIWSQFNKNLLMVADWPKPFKVSGSAKDFQAIQEIVTVIRNFRSERKVSPGLVLNFSLTTNNQTIKNNLHLIEGLAKVKEAKSSTSGQVLDKVSGGIKLSTAKAVLMLEFMASPQAPASTLKAKASLENYLKALKTKLSNQDFIGKAPAAVIAKEQEKLRAIQAKLRQLK